MRHVGRTAPVAGVAIALVGALSAFPMPVIAARGSTTLAAPTANCFPGGTLAAGDYAGSFSVRMNVVAEGVNIVIVTSGPISTITVDKDGRVTAAEGRFSFGLEGSDVLGSSVTGTGGGPFTFKEGGVSSFTMEGSADVAGAFSGQGFSGGSTGSGSSALDFAIDSTTCVDMSGSVKGKFIDDTRAGVASQGATATVAEATWTATRADAGGDDLHAALEEVRAKAQEIADRALAVQGRRTVSDLAAFRALRDEITDGKFTDDENAQHCLLKIVMDLYIPVARKWTKDDLKELGQLAKTATSDADLTRLRRLMSQVIYRDREEWLIGCSHDGGVIAEVGAAATTVASRLSKKAFDRESVSEALAWGRSASLLSTVDDAGGVMAAARSWAGTRVNVTLKKLLAAFKNTTPSDAERAAINALVVEARVAENDAVTLGAMEPEDRVVAEEYQAWCSKAEGGCA